MEMADMFTYDKTYYYLHLQSSLSTNSRRASCTWRGGGAGLSSVLLHSAVPVEEASILVYEEVPYLLMYKSTFSTKKSAQKIALDLYTSRTHRPDKAVQEINITIVWSAFTKPVLIVVEFLCFWHILRQQKSVK